MSWAHTLYFITYIYQVVGDNISKTWDRKYLFCNLGEPRPGLALDQTKKNLSFKP